MLDWLIIGGGIHGTHLSLALTRRYGVPRARLRVLDPYPAPLGLWDALTRNVGMQFLRSPLPHHLHYDQGSLAVFARVHQHEPTTRFVPPYSRPSLALFRRHTDALIDRYQLDTTRIQGRALGLRRLPDGWRVTSDSGELDARRVLIAIGMTEQPAWPAWAEALRAAGGDIHHIFDPHFDRASAQLRPPVVVVGGGITAAQTALALAETQPGEVVVVMRHAIRQHDFDSDPGWMNAIYLRDFAAIRDHDARRAVIARVRHRGSMPPDVAAEMRAASEAGILRRVEGVVESAACDSDTGDLTLSVSVDGRETDILRAGAVILATGFVPKRPGGAWLDALIADEGLPTASCGFPIVDPTLCWARGLYVSGPLAELEIGPPSRNLIGARLAGERLAAVAR